MDGRDRYRDILRNNGKDSHAMTNQDIILFCLDQSVRGGFDAGEFRQALERAPRLPNGDNLVLNALAQNPFGLIYQHKFLQGFFGNRERKLGTMVIEKEWELHARKMVTLEEPLKYLEKFLTAPPYSTMGGDQNTHA